MYSVHYKKRQIRIALLSPICAKLLPNNILTHILFRQYRYHDHKIF